MEDSYTCHAGKKLTPQFIKKQKNKSGYESEVIVYERKDCTDCPYKGKCTRVKGNKRLYISKSFLEKRQESYENILSEKEILYRMNRSIQVEGAFGVLKNDILDYIHFCADFYFCSPFFVYFFTKSRSISSSVASPAGTSSKYLLPLAYIRRVC